MEVVTFLHLFSASASLEQFGKNLPSTSKKKAAAAAPRGSQSSGSKPTGEEHFEEVFGEEVAAQVGRLMMMAVWRSVHFDSCIAFPLETFLLKETQGAQNA